MTTIYITLNQWAEDNEVAQSTARRWAKMGYIETIKKGKKYFVSKSLMYNGKVYKYS